MSMSTISMYKSSLLNTCDSLMSLTEVLVKWVKAHSFSSTLKIGLVFFTSYNVFDYWKHRVQGFSSTIFTYVIVHLHIIVKNW